MTMFCLMLCRILYVCHGALYKQLSAWLFYGLLIDTHGEFFIQEVKSAHEPVINNTDEIDTIGRNDLGIPGITGKQLKEIQETLVRILKRYFSFLMSSVLSHTYSSSLSCCFLQ